MTDAEASAVIASSPWSIESAVNVPIRWVEVENARILLDWVDAAGDPQQSLLTVDGWDIDVVSGAQPSESDLSELSADLLRHAHGRARWHADRFRSSPDINAAFARLDDEAKRLTGERDA